MSFKKKSQMSALKIGGNETSETQIYEVKMKKKMNGNIAIVGISVKYQSPVHYAKSPPQSSSAAQPSSYYYSLYYFFSLLLLSHRLPLPNSLPWLHHYSCHWRRPHHPRPRVQARLLRRGDAGVLIPAYLRLDDDMTLCRIVYY